MKAILTPSSIKGNVHIPPSKSMAHRAIICASLAKGTSTIHNIDYSDDILATISGMEKLGAKIESFEHSLVVHGIKQLKQDKEMDIFAHESGSTLRFFIPIFSLTQQQVTFTGKGRLLDRPQHVYEEIFKKQGLTYLQDKDKIIINGKLKSGDYQLHGNISSQFISGLLFTLPLLDDDSYIHILPPFESSSYVKLTIQMLKEFGIRIEFMDEYTIYIPGKQQYHAKDIMVEGDYSQLAFFAVLATINHDLTITGVNHNSLQGDKAILSILKRGGVDIDEIENGYHIYPTKFINGTIDLENCPDIGPILTVLGMYGKGTMHIKNAQRLRLKESDRIQAMEEELHKLKVDIHSDDSNIFIKGNTNYQGDVNFSSHKDHRIVMSLVIASTLLKQPCTITGVEAINKSYPTFFEDFKKIGGKVEIISD
ncbi:MAG: 3-phosphoshikimate 1-carboxyvinyltransferase [Erysipelotrichaceae bacterium]